MADSFFGGLNQSALFPFLNELLDRVRQQKLADQLQSGITENVTNPGVPLQVPAQQGNATHLSTPAMSLPGIQTNQAQPISMSDPRFQAAVMHFLSGGGDPNSLNMMMKLRQMQEPTFTPVNQEAGGAGYFAQRPGQAPSYTELKPPAIRPSTIPTDWTLSQGTQQYPSSRKNAAGGFEQLYEKKEPDGRILYKYAGVNEPPGGGAGADSRIDKSYQFHTSQVSALAKPLQDRQDRIERLRTSLDAKTPQADALIAPELLTAMAGGQGSGLRMNEAEISRIVGGRNAWLGLKSTLMKYQSDPTKPFLIPDEQRAQIYSLLNEVDKQVQNKQDAIINAQQELANSKDPSEHRRIFSNLRTRLREGQSPGTQKQSSKFKILKVE